MSTYWGYVCQSHDPELESEHWFNRGETLLHCAYDAERAGAFPTGDEFWDANILVDGVDVRWPVFWLRDHPRCQVALRNEYGVTELL